MSKIKIKIYCSWSPWKPSDDEYKSTGIYHQYRNNDTNCNDTFTIVPPYSEVYDYVIINNLPLEHHEFDPAKAIFLYWEPPFALRGWSSKRWGDPDKYDPNIMDHSQYFRVFDP